MVWAGGTAFAFELFLVGAAARRWSRGCRGFFRRWRSLGRLSLGRLCGGRPGRRRRWTGPDKLVVAGIGIVERISLRYISGQYREAECALPAAIRRKRIKKMKDPPLHESNSQGWGTRGKRGGKR